MAFYCYKLESCDLGSYPDIENLCWDTVHPYDALIVRIVEVFQGESPSLDKSYTLIFDGIGTCVCTENVPKIKVLDPQVCSTKQGSKYLNCDTGEEKIFFFANQEPLKSVIKINGECDCWEFQLLDSPATEILYSNYQEFDTCEECKQAGCEEGERTISTAVVLTLPTAAPPRQGF